MIGAKGGGEEREIKTYVVLDDCCQGCLVVVQR